MAYFGAQTKDRKGRPFDDHELSAVIQREIYSATGSLLGTDGGGDLADQRRIAMDAYLGQPFGDEVEGESQVVLLEVMDRIEWMLPDLVETFLAGDNVCEFEPQGPEDEPFVDQVTDYINYLFLEENDGFELLYNWFKDALLQKNGFIKVWWDDSEERETRIFRRLTEDEAVLILADEDTELVTSEEYTDEIDIQDPLTGQTLKMELPLVDMTVERLKSKGRLRVESFPPEEYLVARRSVSIKREEDFFFGAHRYKTTIADLIEMGVPREEAENIPSGDEEEYNEEREARFEADDEWPIQVTTTDPSMRWVWVYECHLRIDMEGNGTPELWQVLVAARGRMILKKERMDEQPVVSITPIPVPHKFFGLSYADITVDLQRIKSILLRMWLDNCYHLQNSRHILHPDVNQDDYLVKRPGAGVRLRKKSQVMPRDAVHPLTTIPIGDQIAPALEYMDGVGRNRTGVDPDHQALQADTLKNKGDAGMNMVLSTAQKRKQLVARIFAETGVPELFNKMLRLVVKNQDREKVIKLRGKWVPMQPSDWNPSMKAKIKVGLGYGSNEQDIAFGSQMLAIQERILAGKAAGADVPDITAQHIFNSVKMVARAAGYKDASQFMADPSDEGQQRQQQEPPPDPALIEAQMKQQIEMEKIQIEREKLQIERQKVQIDAMEKMAKAEAEGVRTQMDSEGKVYDIDRANTQAIAEIEHKRQMAQLELAKLQAQQQEVQAREELAAVQAQAAITKAEAEKANDETRTRLVIQETKLKIELAKEQHEMAKAKLDLEREKLEMEKQRAVASPEGGEGGENGGRNGSVPNITINQGGGTKEITFQRDEKGLSGATIKETSQETAD